MSFLPVSRFALFSLSASSPSVISILEVQESEREGTEEKERTNGSRLACGKRGCDETFSLSQDKFTSLFKLCALSHQRGCARERERDRVREKLNIRWGLYAGLQKRSVFTKRVGGTTMMDERVIIKQSLYYSSGKSSAVKGLFI